MKISTMKGVAVVTSFMLAISSCANVSRRAEDSQRREAFRHVMLLPYCPSEVMETKGGFLELLGVKTVFRALDWLGARLGELLEEDKAGVSLSTKSSGYLWWGRGNGQPLSLATCAVIIHSDSNPATWCGEGGPFAHKDKSYWRVCRFFETGIQSFPQVEKLLPGAWQGQGLPQFYAEIKLEQSDDKNGIKPKSVLYYYPQPLKGGTRASKLRDLALTVSITKLEDGKVVLDPFIAKLARVRPSPEVRITHGVLPSEAAGWIRVVAALDEQSIKNKETKENQGSMEVNITAQVHEVGDPDWFWPHLKNLVQDVSGTTREMLTP